MKKSGIEHQYTIPKTPEQNGVSKRMNRTLIEKVRSMLAESRLPQKFWAEALSTAVYLINRSPTKALDNTTPFEAWYGKKPNVSHLRVFGCSGYAHIPKDERKKLESKAKTCIFLGYSATRKGYCLYDQTTSSIVHSRDVVFNELSRGYKSAPDGETRHIRMENLTDQESEIPDTEGDYISEVEFEQPNNSSGQETDPTPRRSTRVTRPPDYYGVYCKLYII